MAFNCLMEDRCPKHNDIKKGGCPCWWEIPWENEETGETTIKKGCILSQEVGLPIAQTVVRASHVSSEHSSEARNSTEKLDYSIRKLNQLAMQAMNSDLDGETQQLDERNDHDNGSEAIEAE